MPNRRLAVSTTCTTARPGTHFTDAMRPSTSQLFQLAIGASLILSPHAIAQSTNAGDTASGSQHGASQTGTFTLCHPPLTAPVEPASGANSAESIDRIEIYCNAPGLSVPTLRGIDSGSSVTSEHDRPESLDALWVASKLEPLLTVPLRADQLVDRVLEINSTYLKHGYLNSGLRVSEASDLANGSARLDLVFGSLLSTPHPDGEASIQWLGDNPKGLTQSYVESQLPSLTQLPFNSRQLEYDFSLLTEAPAIRRATGSLQPGATPGVAYLDLLVAPEDRFDIYFTASNGRAASIGEDRVGIGGAVRNALFAGDVLAAEFGQTSGLTDASLSYSVAFPSSRTRFLVDASSNDASVVEPALRSLDIRSETRSFSAGITHRLVHNPIGRESLTGGRAGRMIDVSSHFLSNESQTSLLGQPFSFSPGSVDGRSEYQALRVQGEWRERSADSVWIGKLETTFGIDGTSANIDGVATPDTDFVNARLQMTHARRLTPSVEFRARAISQWADGVMYTSERLYAGGMRSVRGYSENLVLADSGLVGSVEVSRAFNLTGIRTGFNWGSFRAGVFAEAATLENNAEIDETSSSLTSIGASFVWTPSPAFNAEIAYGHGLSDNEIARRGESPWHFLITVRPLKM